MDLVEMHEAFAAQVLSNLRGFESQYWAERAGFSSPVGAVDRTKLLVYTASGLAAGLAAVILVSRVSTTRSDMGTGLELDVITAVVLGGTSIFGGKGTIAGTLLGLVLIQALRNGLALAGVKGDGTIVVIGAVLILTILVSNLFGRGGDG